jgi:hypothetical protein
MNAVSEYSQYSARGYSAEYYNMPQMDISSIESQSSGRSSDGDSEICLAGHDLSIDEVLFKTDLFTSDDDWDKFDTFGSALAPYHDFSEINQPPGIHQNHQFNQYLMAGNLAPQPSHPLPPRYDDYSEINQPPGIHQNHQLNQYLLAGNLAPQPSHPLPPRYDDYSEINQPPGIHQNHQLNQYLLAGNLAPQPSSASCTQDIEPAVVVPSATNNKSKRKRISSEKADVVPIDKLVLRNGNERQRTQNLKDGFDNLRKCIPQLPDVKYSKIKTIKTAKDYIKFLQELLESDVRDDQLGLTDNNKDIVSKETIHKAFVVSSFPNKIPAAFGSLTHARSPPLSRS